MKDQEYVPFKGIRSKSQRLMNPWLRFFLMAGIAIIVLIVGSLVLSSHRDLDAGPTIGLMVASLAIGSIIGWVLNFDSLLEHTGRRRKLRRIQAT